MTTFRVAAPSATPRDLAQHVNELRDGKINATGSLTLTPSATTTVVNDFRVSIDTVILLMPKSSTAAAALTSTWVSAQVNGSFTLTHTSDAASDRSYRYAAFG